MLSSTQVSWVTSKNRARASVHSLASTYALKSIKSPHSKLHSVRYNSLKSTVVLQITKFENHSKSLILQLLKWSLEFWLFLALKFIHLTQYKENNYFWRKFKWDNFGDFCTLWSSLKVSTLQLGFHTLKFFQANDMNQSCCVITVKTSRNTNFASKILGYHKVLKEMRRSWREELSGNWISFNTFLFTNFFVPCHLAFSEWIEQLHFFDFKVFCLHSVWKSQKMSLFCKLKN